MEVLELTPFSSAAGPSGLSCSPLVSSIASGPDGSRACFNGDLREGQSVDSTAAVTDNGRGGILKMPEEERGLSGVVKTGDGLRSGRGRFCLTGLLEVG